MPIYEYRCASCSFEKEYLQKVSDPRLTDCPQCGRATFNKLVSAAGFQLKGSGWYATDFKNSGAKPAADANKSRDGDKPAASETKKEEKTEAAAGTGASPSGASGASGTSPVST